ncbi:MAG TPA: hypothetical protein VFN88_11590, partial [Caulobacteraceae bacterium]|nr:hypothetical protein [Caulobacteraceae bacterium]
ADMAEVDAATKAEDYGKACQTAVRAVNSIQKMGERNLRQWQASQAYLDAEAKRRGVSLD